MSKIALVTGAAGGIGRASVEKVAAEGWTVLATDRVEASGFPKGVTFHELDVSEPDRVSQFFTSVSADISALNALVNNAAIQISKPLIEMEVAEWGSCS